VAGVVLRRAGRRRDAREMLARARSILDELGSPLWVARVDGENRRLGGRRSRSDALTPTEERVAELAGQRLRNAEIAARPLRHVEDRRGDALTRLSQARDPVAD
jgi:hypothetical protein